MLIFDENNYCNWRLTPWDSRAFGFNTSEVYGIQYDTKLNELFHIVEQKNLMSKIKLSYFRYDSNDLNMKKNALENGFDIIEFSLYAYHNDISRIPQSQLNLDFYQADSKDVPEIKKIAENVFEHGRFHEDPFISSQLPGIRYRKWIDDLMVSSNMYIFYVKGQVAGFFSYNIVDGWIEMPLSGLSIDAQRLGGFLWVNMFNFIYQKEKVKRIRNLISGSNSAVMNLYSKLGFLYTKPLFGYHKHY